MGFIGAGYTKFGIKLKLVQCNAINSLLKFNNVSNSVSNLRSKQTSLDFNTQYSKPNGIVLTNYDFKPADYKVVYDFLFGFTEREIIEYFEYMQTLLQTEKI